MLIHSFLSNGLPMFNFSKLFLESLKYHNGGDIKVVFSGRDLNKNQMDELKQIYPKLDIVNLKINYQYLSELTGHSVSYLKDIKNKVEERSTGIKDKDQLFWKQLMSVEERYKKSITETMNIYKNYNHMLHLDIDICFNGKVDQLFDIIKENDISLKFRGVSGNNRKIVGYCVGININDNSWKFMNKWVHHIDQIPLINKPKGYGQTTLWYAYRDLKKEVNIGKIPAWMTAHERNYHKKEHSPILLSGNKGSKSSNIQKFSKIYKDSK